MVYSNRSSWNIQSLKQYFLVECGIKLRWPREINRPIQNSVWWPRVTNQRKTRNVWMHIIRIRYELFLVFTLAIYIPCMGVWVTKITGYSRMTEILALRLQVLLITINTAPSLIYTIYSSPLHTHLESPSSLVVSWQRIPTHKLSLQITIKSSFLQSLCSPLS
jgi:hypothetical protein